MLLENEYAFVFEDQFPVTKGHSLIIPKRHFSSYFEATPKELNAIHELLVKRKSQLTIDKSITGYNIGINIGTSAGQTIFHLHVHLIPRRDNDIEKPKGGVRGVVPKKMGY
jgi:diadenosine tetraphosphate (Ap4A) HIT family hydrolase